MTLRIMIAGCAKDEREKVEASVKTALDDRFTESDWSVSLVYIANQWSVEIVGPEPDFTGLSLIATTSDLIEKLQQALSEAPSENNAPARAHAAAPGTTAKSGEKQERHTCEECAAAFDVIFTYTAGEPEELCPVACPACWHINRVPIAEAAGATGDYRAQTAI